MKLPQKLNKVSYLIALLFLCFLNKAEAQKCLSPGDLVILGVNTDANGSIDDEFDVLTLVDLPVNTVIYFTDGGWTGSAIYANEHCRVLTVSTAISAGTVIRFNCTGTTWTATNFTITVPGSAGGYTNNNAGLSTSGDQVLLFQNSVASPIFITAVTTHATAWATSGSITSNESYLPPGLVEGVTAKAVGKSASTDWDDVRFDGTVTSYTSSKNRVMNLIYSGTWDRSDNVYTTLTNFTGATLQKYFRSVTTGDWNNSNVWEVSANNSSWSAASTNDYPNSPDDEVTIRNGHTVDLNNGTFTTAYLKNLTINSGGTLKADINTADRYLKLYGNVTVNGTLGNGTTDDYSVFDLMGSTHTFDGTPTDMVLGRIRNNCFCQTTTSLALNADMTLDYASAGIYNNTSGQSLNVSIAAGKTVSLRDNTDFSIDGVDGTGSGTRTGTLTVNGTLNVGGSFYLKTDNAAGNNISVTVNNGGKIKIDNTLEGNTGTGPSTATLTLNSGATLELTGPKSGNDPSNNISTTLNTFAFNTGSSVIYSKTSGTQQVEDEFGTIAANQHYGNLTLQNGATKLLEGNILVRGNLLLAQTGGAKLDADNTNNYSITLKGNWTDNSTAEGFDERGGTVTLSGTAKQTLSGSTDLVTFNNLIVNNNTAGSTYDDVLLNANTEVRGVLTLTNGIIKSSSSDPFTLFDGASVSSSGNPEMGNSTVVANMGHRNSYINGPCVWTWAGTQAEKTFPVGKSGKFGPCSVTPVSATTGEFTAEYFSSAYSNTTVNTAQNPKLDHVSVQEYWNINRTTTSNSAQVKLFWKRYSSNSISLFNSLRVAHFDGSLWSMEGNTFGSSTSTLSIDSSNGINWGFIKGAASASFSPFTLGTLASFVPLPFNWIKLSATENVKSNLIKFSVSQTDQVLFEIEKYSNGEFTKIGSLGALRTASIQQYEFNDLHTETVSYYRIKAINTQGVAVYSDIFSCTRASKPGFQLWPNPAGNNISFKLTEINKNEVYTYALYDALGRVNASGNYTENMVLDLSGFTSGFYIAELKSSSGQVSRTRFFKK